jgi:hypothetical protein
MVKSKSVPWTKMVLPLKVKGKIYNPSRYCGVGLPKDRLADGCYLVHNHVRPSGQLGMNGFRAWVQKGRTSPELVECTCDFGGLKNANVNPHYRVKRD